MADDRRPRKETSKVLSLDELKLLDERITVLSDEGPEKHTKEELTYELLCGHPWVKRNVADANFTIEGKEWKVTYDNLGVDPRKFQKHMKNIFIGEGRPMPREFKVPNDDQTYSCRYNSECKGLSGLLCKYQTRGFTRFAFELPDGTTTNFIVRGLNKFTGLTAADEDDVSEVSDIKEVFFLDGISYRAADTLGVSKKSNGENAKGTLRKVGDVWWVLAGSKNTCLPFPLTPAHDPRVVYAAKDATLVYAPIMHSFVDFVRGLQVNGKFDDFANTLQDNAYVVLFEYNQAHHEHLFPIESDFVEGFAIRGNTGLAIPPREAFALFEKFGFPCVTYRERPGGEIDAVVAEVRNLQDTEGVVVYFMLEDRVIGCLKVKTDFYTIARATREIFKRIVNALSKAFKGKVNSGWNPDASKEHHACRDRIRNRMKRMTQIPEYQRMWPRWTAVARGFVDWWTSSYKAIRDEEVRREALARTREKFGSLYAEYLRELEAGRVTLEPEESVAGEGPAADAAPDAGNDGSYENEE